MASLKPDTLPAEATGSSPCVGGHWCEIRVAVGAPSVLRLRTTAQATSGDFEQIDPGNLTYRRWQTATSSTNTEFMTLCSIYSTIGVREDRSCFHKQPSMYTA